jgi:hypothetical protein
MIGEKFGYECSLSSAIHTTIPFLEIAGANGISSTLVLIVGLIR